MEQKHIRNGLFFIGACVVIALALFLISRCSKNSGVTDRLGENEIASSSVDFSKECGNPATYDLIKRELFRLAALNRGSDAAVYLKIAGYTVVQVDRPLYVAVDAGSGRVSCSGSVSIELPPNLVDEEGRRTLVGDINYFIQAAADGSGNSVTVSDADALTSSLATLRKVGFFEASPPDIVTNDDESAPEADISASTSEAGTSSTASSVPAELAQNTATAAGPSFDCGRARTPSERAVCSNSGLAALDRAMSTRYVNALATADPVADRLLRQSGNAFLGYRDRCGNDAICIDRVYRGRIREIDDVVAGRWRETR